MTYIHVRRHERRRASRSRIITFSSVVDARRYLLSKIKRVRVQRQKVLKDITEVQKAKQKIERQFRRIPKRRYPESHKLTGVEREALYKIADRHGVARDLIDFNAYIDPTLTFNENKQIIEEQVRLLARYQTLSVKEQQMSKDLKRYDEQLKAYITELEWRSRNLPFEDRQIAEGQLKAYQ